MSPHYWKSFRSYPEYAGNTAETDTKNKAKIKKKGRLQTVREVCFLRQITNGSPQAVVLNH